MSQRAGVLMLIAVIGIAIGGLYWADRYRAQYEAESKRFHARDTAHLVRITLIEKHADTVYRQIYLVRRNGRWWVNDTLEAFIDPVQRLIRILAGQIPRSPIPQTARTNVLRFLKEHRIEVTLQYADGETDAFFVGGPTPDQRATYMLKPSADQPYEVFFPGFEGYLTPYYVPDLNAWQENLVFRMRVADLERVSLTYHDDPTKSWTIERSHSDSPWQLIPQDTPDSLRLGEYLLSYNGALTADEIVSPDSLAGLLPLYELSLRTFSQKRFQISIYPHRSSPLHYYLRLHHSPYFTYLISRNRMDTYLVPRSYFLRVPS